MKRKKLLFLIISILALTSCSFRKYYNRQKFLVRRMFFVGPLAEGPLTIFIHGTKTSVFSRMIHQLDYPLGVTCASLHRINSILNQLPITLSAADPEQFDRNRFYFYSWPGYLTFTTRLQAAERLYSIIKGHKGPLTIITHSHGCNVALNLAYCAQKDENTSLQIDKLILLAPPVQVATKKYVCSPLFKEVYTFYSSADLMQIGDPQGIYWHAFAATLDPHLPLLSKRTFEPAPHIIQTRIMLDWQSPGHVNFLLSRFLKQLPTILKLVKHQSEIDEYERTKNFYTVNIPPCDLPPFIVEKEKKRTYIPRSTYYKARKIAKQEKRT